MHYYMASVCNRYDALSEWPILEHYSPVMPTGRLPSIKTYNKQFINLERLVLTEKFKPGISRINLAIARSIRQGLGLRFSHKDLTLE